MQHYILAQWVLVNEVIGISDSLHWIQSVGRKHTGARDVHVCTVVQTMTFAVINISHYCTLLHFLKIKSRITSIERFEIFLILSIHQLHSPVPWVIGRLRVIRQLEIEIVCTVYTNLSYDRTKVLQDCIIHVIHYMPSHVIRYAITV